MGDSERHRDSLFYRKIYWKIFLLFVVSGRRLATGYAANVRINRASQKRNAIDFTLGSTVLMLDVDRAFKLRACFNKIVKVDILAAYTFCVNLCPITRLVHRLF